MDAAQTTQHVRTWTAGAGCFLLLTRQCSPPHRPPQARTEALNFGRLQVDYALGRMGRSYVAGFGTNPPLRVRSSQ